MMSRAERAMELTAQLHTLDRLRKVALKVPGAQVREGFVGPDDDQVRMLRHELTELRRQMGGSERRKFEALLAAWQGQQK